MRRPGFARLRYDWRTRRVTLLRKSHVDNRRAKKSYGQMLDEIARELRSYFTGDETLVLLREGGFSRFARETRALSEVMGVADLLAWENGAKTFVELAPGAIKKAVAGDARAEKGQVARALIPYVGEQEYACDDESDAVAVGVAWLLLSSLISVREPGAERDEKSWPPHESI